MEILYGGVTTLNHIFELHAKKAQFIIADLYVACHGLLLTQKQLHAILLPVNKEKHSLLGFQQS